MKYSNLEALAAAYKSGELPQDRPLMLDNDTVSVWNEGDSVFEMHPAELQEQVLDLLGIPHEPV
jgi:hypothetical protein